MVGRADADLFRAGSFDLCWNCHEAKMVLEEETTVLTGFRNWNRNLHFVHVN